MSAVAREIQLLILVEIIAKFQKSNFSRDETVYYNVVQKIVKFKAMILFFFHKRVRCVFSFLLQVCILCTSVYK